MNENVLTMKAKLQVLEKAIGFMEDEAKKIQSISAHRKKIDDEIKVLYEECLESTGHVFEMKSAEPCDEYFDKLNRVHIEEFYVCQHCGYDVAVTLILAQSARGQTVTERYALYKSHQAGADTLHPYHECFDNFWNNSAGREGRTKSLLKHGERLEAIKLVACLQ